LLKKHIHTLDFLRGLSALGVVALHFTLTSFFVKDSNSLTTAFAYGKYGVHVFFVISGFIIPFSMMKSEYQLGHYLSYLKRRFTRVCLPSYVSILITFLLYYAVIILLGRPINNFNWPGINLSAVLGNLTYTVSYLKTSWYNPVYWTLAIEFQFYILIGLIYPLIKRKNNLQIISLFCFCLILGAYLPLESFFTYSGFFVLGICLFLKRAKIMPLYLNVFLFIVASLFCFFQHGYVALIFSLVTFFLIFSELDINTKVTNYLGKISFSIYITHCVVEIFSEVFINRFIDVELSTFNRMILLVAHLTVTIAFATIFYKYIEEPFALYSKKMKFLKRNKAKTIPKL